MRKASSIKIERNIQKIRKSYGYTQEKLAEQIEVSTRYISEVEQDRTKPSYEVLVRFCNTFKIGLDDIFCDYLEGTDKKELKYELAGYDTLKQKDKQTIEHLVTFFNSVK